jgi:hypothetical protein
MNRLLEYAGLPRQWRGGPLQTAAVIPRPEPKAHHAEFSEFSVLGYVPWYLDVEELDTDTVSKRPENCGEIREMIVLAATVGELRASRSDADCLNPSRVKLRAAREKLDPIRSLGVR